MPPGHAADEGRLKRTLGSLTPRPLLLLVICPSEIESLMRQAFTADVPGIKAGAIAAMMFRFWQDSR